MLRENREDFWKCGYFRKRKSAHTFIPSKDFIIHSVSLKILNARGSPQVWRKEKWPWWGGDVLNLTVNKERIALCLKMMNIWSMSPKTWLYIYTTLVCRLKQMLQSGLLQGVVFVFMHTKMKKVTPWCYSQWGKSKERKIGYASCRTPILIIQGGEGNHKPSTIHRVMMMAISPIFNPKQWVLWEVDHIDGITGNNDISNLRWVLPMTNKES